MSGLLSPFSEGRRLSLCEDVVVTVGAWYLPRVLLVKRPPPPPEDDDVVAMAVDENDRKPEKGGASLGETEVVLLRFR